MCFGVYVSQKRGKPSLFAHAVEDSRNHDDLDQCAVDHGEESDTAEHQRRFARRGPIDFGQGRLRSGESFGRENRKADPGDSHIEQGGKKQDAHNRPRHRFGRIFDLFRDIDHIFKSQKRVKCEKSSQHHIERQRDGFGNCERQKRKMAGIEVISSRPDDKQQSRNFEQRHKRCRQNRNSDSPYRHKREYNQ